MSKYVYKVSMKFEFEAIKNFVLYKIIIWSEKGLKTNLGPVPLLTDSGSDSLKNPIFLSYILHIGLLSDNLKFDRTGPY